MAGELREAKIAALTGAGPQQIGTANIGCLMHLAPASPVPVRHWIEAVDEVVRP
jgi:glycolate oxidase iron-sulfur subunit